MRLIIGDEYILDSNVPAGWSVFGKGPVKARLISLTGNQFVFETPHGKESFHHFSFNHHPELVVKHLPVNLENV